VRGWRPASVAAPRQPRAAQVDLPKVPNDDYAGDVIEMSTSGGSSHLDRNAQRHHLPRDERLAEPER